MKGGVTSNNDDTAGDAAYAARLQDSEFEYAQAIPPGVVPVAGRPYVATAPEGGESYVVWGTPPPGPFIAEPILGTAALAPHEAKLMETYSLGRALRVLAIVDGVILLINCLYFPVLYMFLAFPFAGFMAGSRFSLGWTYTYCIYYVARLSMDLAYTILGYWWFFFIFLINAIIMRFILRFASLLHDCSSAEVQQLRSPSAVWASAPRPIFGIV